MVVAGLHYSACHSHHLLAHIYTVHVRLLYLLAHIYTVHVRFLYSTTLQSGSRTKLQARTLKVTRQLQLFVCISPPNKHADTFTRMIQLGHYWHNTLFTPYTSKVLTNSIDKAFVLQPTRHKEDA